MASMTYFLLFVLLHNIQSVASLSSSARQNRGKILETNENLFWKSKRGFPGQDQPQIQGAINPTNGASGLRPELSSVPAVQVGMPSGQYSTVNTQQEKAAKPSSKAQPSGLSPTGQLDGQAKGVSPQITGPTAPPVAESTRTRPSETLTAADGAREPTERLEPEMCELQDDDDLECDDADPDVTADCIRRMRRRQRRQRLRLLRGRPHGCNRLRPLSDECEGEERQNDWADFRGDTDYHDQGDQEGTGGLRGQGGRGGTGGIGGGIGGIGGGTGGIGGGTGGIGGGTGGTGGESRAEGTGEALYPTWFPGSLLFLASWGRKRRDFGNEIALYLVLYAATGPMPSLSHYLRTPPLSRKTSLLKPQDLEYSLLRYWLNLIRRDDFVVSLDSLFLLERHHKIVFSFHLLHFNSLTICDTVIETTVQE